VERLLARFTDSIIVINNEDYAAASCFHLKPGGRVWMIPGVGLDVAAFAAPKPTERAENRRNHGIAPEHFLLLSVGELNENKNHQVILSALKLLKSRHQLPEDLRYGICGDGFLRARLEQIIADYGLGNVVHLFGYCTDIRNYLCMADAVAFPSMREGLGMAALEALSMGIPVLASDNRGTREYMRPGENGFLCEWSDAEGFADRILMLHGMSQEERSTMEKACRDSAEPFSRDKVGIIMQAVYQEIDRKPVKR
jgi:glycosyltransferase EpsD